jgi:hypothetical protein
VLSFPTKLEPEVESAIRGITGRTLDSNVDVSPRASVSKVSCLGLGSEIGRSPFSSGLRMEEVVDVEVMVNGSRRPLKIPGLLVIFQYN